MDKNFDGWNERKIHRQIQLITDFHEREIWWCSIGINVGSEQHSQTNDFSRPILVVKKFTRDVFWGIPLTTKTKDLDFRARFNLGGVENDLLILQMRVYDRKRLIRKIGTIPKNDFTKLTDIIRNLL